MDSVDLEVLKRCVEWQQGGHRVLLVTVVKTWGSSPRPEGAMLAVRDDGLVEGSVSGGCIEDDIVVRIRNEGMTSTRCETVTYGVSADEARRFGLPCGGTIQLATNGSYSVTQPSDWWYGPDAFPAISSAIVIQGNGATISRAPGSQRFRFFYVSGGFSGLSVGSLALQNLTLTNGFALGGNGGNAQAGGGGGAGLGGAIFNQGTVMTTNVVFAGNAATGGTGGVGDGGRCGEGSVDAAGWFNSSKRDSSTSLGSLAATLSTAEYSCASSEVSDAACANPICEADSSIAASLSSSRYQRSDAPLQIVTRRESLNE